jgi:hypothetical protein
MKGHRYRITVEHLEDAKGSPVQAAPLSFEARNHDDVLSIVQRMQARGTFPPDVAAQLAVGLKLFGEVMLQYRDEEIFKPLQPAFGEFMKGLKKGPGAAPSDA